MSALIAILVGKLANAGLAFAVGIVAARVLGAADFGLFTVSMSVLVITLELSGSESLDNGLVRLASEYRHRGAGGGQHIIRLVLRSKLAIALAVLVAWATLSHPLAARFGWTPELTAAVTFGLLGGTCGSLWRFCLAVTQLRERFGTYALINAVPNIIKLTAVLGFLATGMLTLDRLLTLNFTSVALGLLVSLALIPREAPAPVTPGKGLGRELFNFVGWLYMANLLFALLSRLDIFALTALADEASVGIYSAALTLITALELVYVSLLTRLLPEASRATTRGQLLAHMKRSLRLSALLCMPMLLLFFLAPYLITLAYSAEYLAAAPVFRIQLFGFLFTLLLNPFLLVLYARRKPQVFVLLFAVLMLAAISGYATAIPRYGITGAAWTMAGIRIAGAWAVLGLALRELRAPKRQLRCKIDQ